MLPPSLRGTLIMRIMRGPLTRVGLLAAILIAGSTGVRIVGQELAQFTSRAELVVLHATVTDARGRFVGGLSQQSFRVFEDRVPQEVTFFLEQDAPAAVALVVDNSGSMSKNRDRVVAAVAAMADAGHPEDEYFAVTFNERVFPLIADGHRFTGDPLVLRAALAARPAPRGRTALYDAVATALDEVAHSPLERKVVVVVSDGGDNASTTTFEHVLRKAQASNAVIYAVALVDPLVNDRNPKLLQRLAVTTGGRAFAPASVERAETAIRDVGRDIRSSYTLAYVSSNTARDGGLRQVQLAVMPPKGTSLVVRTRTAYLAPAENLGGGDAER